MSCRRCQGKFVYSHPDVQRMRVVREEREVEVKRLSGAVSQLTQFITDNCTCDPGRNIHCEGCKLLAKVVAELKE